MKKIILGLILTLALNFGVASAENWVHFATDAMYEGLEDGYQEYKWYCDLDSLKNDGTREIIDVVYIPDDAKSENWYRYEIALNRPKGQFMYLQSQSYKFGKKQYSLGGADEFYRYYGSKHPMAMLSNIIAKKSNIKGYPTLDAIVTQVSETVLSSTETFSGNWIKLDPVNQWYYNEKSIEDKGNGFYVIEAAYFTHLSKEKTVEDNTKIWIKRYIVDTTRGLISESWTNYVDYHERTLHYRKRDIYFVSPQPQSVEEKLVHIIKRKEYKDQKGFGKLIESKIDTKSKRN